MSDRIDHEAENKRTLVRKRGDERVNPYAISEKQRDDLALSREKERQRRSRRGRELAILAIEKFKAKGGSEGYRQLAGLREIGRCLSYTDKRRFGGELKRMMEEVRRKIRSSKPQ